MHKLHVSVSQNEISTEVVKTVEQHPVEAQAMHLRIGFEVGLDALQRPRSGAARDTSSCQVQDQVKAFWGHITPGGLDAATVAVKRSANAAQPREQGRHKMRRTRGV